MEPPDYAELLDAGSRIAALALIIGGVVLFVMGRSAALGTSFRSTVDPVLRWVRDRTSLSRSELADLTVLVSIGLAAGSALLERHLLSPLLVVGLAYARPSIRRMTRDENRLQALASHLSIDLVIGLYTPVMLAQFLLADVLLGGSLLAVVVALSWPPGGGGTTIPGRRWRLATVTP